MVQSHRATQDVLLRISSSEGRSGHHAMHLTAMQVHRIDHDGSLLEIRSQHLHLPTDLVRLSSGWVSRLRRVPGLLVHVRVDTVSRIVESGKHSSHMLVPIALR